MKFCEFSYQSARYASELCARRNLRSRDSTAKWWNFKDTESREAIKDALSGSQETMFDKIKVPELPRIRKEVERVRRTVKRVHTFTSTKELRDRFDLKDIKLPSLS